VSSSFGQGRGHGFADAGAGASEEFFFTIWKLASRRAGALRIGLTLIPVLTIAAM
jgi:hypothetical protein